LKRRNPKRQRGHPRSRFGLVDSPTPARPRSEKGPDHVSDAHSPDRFR
jgi:hypothetical protein